MWLLKGHFHAVQCSLAKVIKCYINVYLAICDLIMALPDPVKVSSDPSPVVVVVSLLFMGSVLTARRDTT